MFGRARLDGRRQAAERCNVALEIPVGFRRQIADRDAELSRPRIDLVVHVGDVARVGDVLWPVNVPQQPEQHVEDNRWARIANVGEVVDGRAAHVYTHALGIERREYPLLARQRIVELELQMQRPSGACWPRALLYLTGEKT